MPSDPSNFTSSEDEGLIRKWRPWMGWMYIAICVFDFIIGPFFYAWYAWYTRDVSKFGEWKPLTLEGGGVFHLSMGAILGVTSWTRGQEKIRRIDFDEQRFNFEKTRYYRDNDISENDYGDTNILSKKPKR